MLVTTEPRSFCIVPKWVYQLGPRAAHTYGCLVAFADNEEHACWPRLATLAEFGGVSVATLRAGIRDLEAIGAVEVSPRFDDSGVQRSNRYHLRTSDPRVQISKGRVQDLDPELNPGELDPLSGANAPDVLCEERDVLHGQDPSAIATNANGSVARAPAHEPAREERADVARVSEQLVAHVLEQTDRVPTAGVRWHRDLRLMLDRDDVSEADALAVIAWLRGPGGAQFWARNVLSATTLREKFPRLLLEQRRYGGAALRSSTAALAARLREQGE